MNHSSFLLMVSFLLVSTGCSGPDDRVDGPSAVGPSSDAGVPPMLAMDGGGSTGTPLALRCGADSCHCEDGSPITFSRICDGADQCPGGEDESACGWPDLECAGAECFCATGEAIQARSLCDADFECPGGEDEEGCGWPEMPCSPDEDGDWRCLCEDGEDIGPHYRCDGDFDCAGGEDELGCAGPSIVCDPSTGDCLCPDGETITDRYRCDGDMDCAGGEDEEGCGWPDLGCREVAGEWLCFCADGETIDPRHRCDDDWDCAGGEDEEGCGWPDYTCEDNDCVCTQSGREFRGDLASCVECADEDGLCPGKYDVEFVPTELSFYADVQHRRPEDLLRRWRVVDQARRATGE